MIIMKKDSFNFAKTKSRQFLDHFNAAIRQRHGGHPSTSTADTLPTGEFQTTIADSLEIHGKRLDFSWKIVQTPSGELRKIETIPHEIFSNNSQLQSEVEKLYGDVLTAAFAERKNKFFKRNYFCYIGPNLDGEYWIKKVRIAPCRTEDDMNRILNVERVLCIDMEIDAIDDYIATILGDEFSNKLIYRLSLITNTGFYNLQNEHVWVLTGKSEQPADRLQRGFVDPDSTNIMHRKGQLCKLGAFEGSIDNLNAPIGKMVLPKETRGILSKLESANRQLTDAFDAAARMFNVSYVAGRHFPTVRLAYLVSCVDAILSRTKSSLSFTSFLQEYGGDIFDESLVKVLWDDIRSAHFHGGAFSLDTSFLSSFDLTNIEAVSSSAISVHGYRIIRTAIVNWIKRAFIDST